MTALLNKIDAFVWGTPTLLLIFFTGVIISVRSNFFQIRYFKTAFKTFFKKGEEDGKAKMTPFQSASTALSATMGTGNIVGVAGAVVLGGPGVVFWMWVSAIFCMIIKFAEIVLSVRYREQRSDGNYQGGAMYYIKNALPNIFSPLAFIFCFCGIMAAFGVGNLAQINTISTSIGALVQTVANVSPRGKILLKILIGIICAVCSAVVLKNDGSIGRFCEKIFPVMTILYIGMTAVTIAANYNRIPTAISQIFVGAFNPGAVTGGVIGSAFVGMRFGMSRGVFSNEAGLGTAPTVYACSRGDQVSLGMMGIMEVFIDTVVVCTLSALAILCAGNITYGVDTAAGLTLGALESVFGAKIIFLFCPVVCFFAFSSVIGWGLYGTKFALFLFGNDAKKAFLLLFVLVQIPAAFLRAETVWVLAEIFNGLMAIPNITALLFLNDKVIDIIYTYKNKDTA